MTPNLFRVVAEFDDTPENRKMISKLDKDDEITVDGIGDTSHFDYLAIKNCTSIGEMNTQKDKILRTTAIEIIEDRKNNSKNIDYPVTKYQMVAVTGKVVQIKNKSLIEKETKI